MKISGCAEDEFTCKDGQCIDINTRCDQIVNCRDNSDESNCNLLLLNPGYNFEVPPFTTVSSQCRLINSKACEFQDESHKLIQAEVNISTTLETVIDIDEQNHIIELKFQIFLEWYEHRAKYQNLKINQALNILKIQEINQLWIPYLTFKVKVLEVYSSVKSSRISTQNTDDNRAITIGDVYSTLYVTREGVFQRAGLNSVDEAEIFLGSENKITLIQSHNIRFHCTYLIHDFPFDSQVSNCPLKRFI